MRKLLLVACLAVLMACEEDLPTFKNTAPSPVEITIESTTETSVFITWTAATDMENDSVYYDVFLEGERVQGGSNLRVREYNFTNLDPATIYSGVVSSRDDFFEATEVPFNFRTDGLDTTGVAQQGALRAATFSN